MFAGWLQLSSEQRKQRAGSQGEEDDQKTIKKGGERERERDCVGDQEQRHRFLILEYTRLLLKYNGLPSPIWFLKPMVPVSVKNRRPETGQLPISYFEIGLDQNNCSVEGFCCPGPDFGPEQAE